MKFKVHMKFKTSLGQTVETGETSEELWTYRSKIGRVGILRYGLRGLWKDRLISSESWSRDGRRHREDFSFEYHPDGSIAKETWFEYHYDRPAVVNYFEGKVFPGDTRTLEELAKDGAVSVVEWSRYDKLHRGDGPARIKYYSDGSIRSESWSRDGKWHRDDGPSYILYREGKVFPGDTRTFEELERDGAVRLEDWYLDGKRVKRFTRRFT